ncbi:MAG: DUF397 domain-containing protein [Pseudonocardiales bacterium]|nr:DUF397 domain-containing protein [Pseudonocardiales bacterium]
MRASDASHATWRKSSRTNTGSDQTACVEVAQLADQVAIRDSKNPTGPALALPRAQWQAFLTSIQTSDFD